MTTNEAPTSPILQSASSYRRGFLFAFSVFVFLIPLKFGNPIVLDSMSIVPQGGWDWFFSMWPNQIALLVVFLFLAASFWTEPGKRLSPRSFWLPCLFLATQLAAMPSSITPQVSLDTLILFAAGLAMYTIGLRQIGGEKLTNGPLTAMVLATGIVCLVTIQQYFGGLDETRKFFELYFSSEDVPSDYLVKLQGDRPFSTFVYPNSLAGFLILALPLLVARIWKLRGKWEVSAVWVVLVAMVGLVLFSLVLCGSKGGFLSLAGVVVIAVLFVRFPGRWKVIFCIVLLVCGAGLVARYGKDIVRYSLSTGSARVEYWKAGIRMFHDFPWLGTGPGTFGSIYPKYNPGTSEDPRLAHNNFLEALTDTGMAGFLAYAALWLWPFLVALRKLRTSSDPIFIGLTLSIAGWILHGLIDFDQYIPSLSLIAFLLLGMLVAELEEREEAQPTPRSFKLVLTILAILLCLLPASRLLAVYHANEGRTLGRTNMYAALREWGRAMQFAPLDAVYRFESARLQTQTGNDLAAQKDLLRARILDPYRSTYAWGLAKSIRDQQGLSGEYFDAAEQAVALAPQNWSYRMALARDYEASGRRDLAEVHWQAYDQIRIRLNKEPRHPKPLLENPSN